MIDFGKIEAAVRVDPDFILSKISQEQIFYFYFGHFEFGKVYPSKFRKDNSPSTGFYINKSGNLTYNDLKTTEKHNCFTFVQKLYELSFHEALNKIALDFGLIKQDGVKPIAQKILDQGIKFDREQKKDTLIQIIPASWNSDHKKYWNDYHISKDRLIKEEVYPVSRLWINKVECKRLDSLCFVYVVKEKGKRGEPTREYYKIYQPYSKEMKWVNNVPITVPFGLHSLKYGNEHIAIGKAQKDRLILLNFFESTIGTQNESESALPHGLVNHLSFNFPRRTIIWDADETGVENCKKFNDKGFGYFNTPKELLEDNIKDVSDYVKAFGMNAFEKLLKQKNII